MLSCEFYTSIHNKMQCDIESIKNFVPKKYQKFTKYFNKFFFDLHGRFPV